MNLSSSAVSTISSTVSIISSTVSKIFSTWIKFHFIKLQESYLWLPQEVILSGLPKIFYELHPKTRVVLDAAEISVDKPSLPDVQQITFCTYKSHNILKSLVGILQLEQSRLLLKYIQEVFLIKNLPGKVVS